MEVPRIDHDAAGVGAVDEDGDVMMIGFGMGERAVQHDVDRVVHRFVGVQLDDDDPIPVVVDQCHRTGAVRGFTRRTVITPRGVHNGGEQVVR
jgi:hypothetical protein